jgi:hypothetical protein
MAKLTFQVTASLAEFSDFADRLGYMSEVSDIVDGQVVVSPNPETKQNFLLRVLKEQIATTFYTPFVQDIDYEVRTQRDADKEATRESVRNRVAVTFTA